jgi:hypothetical protein
MATETAVQLEPIDTSDVDLWVGKPIGGGQLKEPVSVTDIRRWAQGMSNPNRLYFDEKFAAASDFGYIVAPQSFTICCDVGHGATPSIQGTIPGSHMLFGGDEWWFFGPRIKAGDKLHSERFAYDYRVTNTKFAGPTMFQRGDTTYINQRGEIVARQRSTSIRYLVSNAIKLRAMLDMKAPEWTDEALERVQQEKIDYYLTFKDHVRKSFGEVKVGEELPRRPIGPHSDTTFATEWRSYLMTVWGSHEPDGLPTSTSRAGWLPVMSSDPVRGQIDPSLVDGLYTGASRGHANTRYAREIGMPRGYGYGATMGAWVTDYVTNWAGQRAMCVHSNIQYRNPALTGDVTYLTGKVLGKELEEGGKSGIVTVQVDMATHEDAQMARGPVEIRFPV